MVNLNQTPNTLSPESRSRDAKLVYPSKAPSKKNPFRADDVISSLSNAHENRRARQVVEWERLARQHFQLNA